MTNSKKWIRTALALLIVGIVLFGICFAASGFDFSRLNTVEYETNEYALSADFQRIKIDANTARIVLKPAENGNCSVTCYEETKCKHTVTVQDGVLAIRAEDSRKWYERFGVSFETPEITVYLPAGAYESLSVDTDTGDVSVPSAFSFDSVDIHGDTSSVTCLASVNKDLSIAVTTGNISVSDLHAGSVHLSTTTGRVQADRVVSGGDFTADVRTGSVALNDVTCVRLSSGGSTGSATLRNVMADQEIRLERSTGSVRLDRCDAPSIFVKTSTGSVSGTLLRPMIFTADSNTGHVQVPASVPDGGMCEIHTTTGNITIDVE